MQTIAHLSVLLLWLLSQMLGLAHPVSSWSVGGNATGFLALVHVKTATCDYDADLCPADYAVALLTATTAISAHLDEARQTSLAYDAVPVPIFPANEFPRGSPVGKGEFLAAKGGDDLIAFYHGTESRGAASIRNGIDLSKARPV